MSLKPLAQLWDGKGLKPVEAQLLLRVSHQLSSSLHACLPTQAPSSHCPFTDAQKKRKFKVSFPPCAIFPEATLIPLKYHERKQNTENIPEKQLFQDKVKVKVAQWCPTLCNPMDCILPGSSVHGLLQARILEWVAIPFCRESPKQELNWGLQHCKWILYQLSHQESPRILEWVAYPFSRGSSLPRNQTRIFCIAGRFFTSWATREAPKARYTSTKRKYMSFYFSTKTESSLCTLTLN